ncbi:GTPase [Planctomycetota bacterium]
MREIKNDIPEKNTFAALVTGKGSGAISTIEVFGDSAQDVLNKIFKSSGTAQTTFNIGQILLGIIGDGEKTIDQVTIGCEKPDTYAINCHGNPLIVEMIMQLLERYGVEILSDEQLRLEILSRRSDLNSIALEAKLYQSKTIHGTKIISNQAKAGLSKKAKGWLENINKISLDKIMAEAGEIHEKSHTAKLIIYGCTAILVGPPNSGKSTLLNFLSGRQKAIVTDIKGTTRDWITAQCQIGPLSVELIDTAGLDELILEAGSAIDKTAQNKSIELLQKADLILLILDKNREADESDYNFTEKISGKKIITVLNKADLNTRFNTNRLPEYLSNTVSISAKKGIGIENLKNTILATTGTESFDLHQGVCFTARQENLIQQLLDSKTPQQAVSVITELLNGRVCV